MKTSTLSLLATLTTALALLGGIPIHAQAPAAPASAVANRAEILLKQDAEFAKLCETQGAEKAFEACLAPDAVSPVAEMDQPADRASLINRIKRIDESAGTLKWTPIKADLAVSGDLGYTYGKWSVVRRVGDGYLLHGYYTTVWKKGADGTWKIVFVMNNETPI